jgi:quercetin 2,3-dioxygenase
MTNYRTIERIIHGQRTSDGDGVRLTRLFNSELHQRLDPFLMLDAFGSNAVNDYIGGFPDHPHRGFETVTYMLEGRMRHHDSAGNSGLLENGGVQWMSAGRGVVHREMPEQESGRMSGFQLWLNLPASQKMQDPWYKDIPCDQIPEVTQPGAYRVKVIAGEFNGVIGAVQRPRTHPLYLDVRFLGQSQTLFSIPLPVTYNAFLYVYEGLVELPTHPTENHVTDHATDHAVDHAESQGQDIQTVKAGEMAVLSNDSAQIELRGHPNSQFILIAGMPLHEPIVQYGPFVMNTKEEIIQAMNDFRRGALTEKTA